jgi:hypothetical protein
MNQTPTKKRKLKSSGLIDISKKKKDLQVESEVDLLSASDNDSITVAPIAVKSLNVNGNEPSKPTCCLVCSISSALSNVNCCPEHLAILTGILPAGLPAQIVYMMPPVASEWSKLECRCRSHCLKSKRRSRSLSSYSLSSSSSCSSTSRHSRKTRLETVESSVRKLMSIREMYQKMSHFVFL